MLSVSHCAFVGQEQTEVEPVRRPLALVDLQSRSEARVVRRSARAWPLRSRPRRNRVLTLPSEIPRVLAVSETLSSRISRRINTWLLREDSVLTAFRIALRTCFLSQT